MSLDHFPAEHGLHCDWVGRSVQRPAVQFLHDGDLTTTSSWNLPMGHSSHVAMDVEDDEEHVQQLHVEDAPGDTRKCPFWQLHTEELILAPCVLENILLPFIFRSTQCWPQRVCWNAVAPEKRLSYLTTLLTSQLERSMLNLFAFSNSALALVIDPTSHADMSALKLSAASNK